MPKLKQGSSAKAQYKAYAAEGRHEKNKLAKLIKLAKSQPNNKPVQSALEKALGKGVVYTRNRKSNGHKCRGLNKSLGFEKNQMSELMKKSKLDLHWYCGVDLSKQAIPNHGQSMCVQLESMGYKKKHYVRKHKKTTR